MPKNQIIKYLKDILANRDMIQRVRDLNFDKEVLVRYDQELECIMLRNRNLERPDIDGEEEIIDELDDLIREIVNELKNFFPRDNELIICY